MSTALSTLPPKPEPIRTIPTPATIVAIDPTSATELVAFLDEAAALVEGLVDAESREAACRGLERVVGIFDAIEAGRVAAKARPLELTRQIDDACRPYLTAAAGIKRSLEVAINGFDKRAEARRLEAEQARKRAEADAAEAARALESKRAAEVEAARMAATTPAEIEAAEELAAKAEAEVVEVLSAPMAVPVPKAPPKSPVTVANRETAVLVDATLVPVSIAGVVIRPPDMEAIEKLLLAGVPVPGCRLDVVEVLGTKRAGSRRR